MLEPETCGAEGQTYSLFQESSIVETPTLLAGFEVVTIVRRFATQAHSAAIAQHTSGMSAIMKFSAETSEDPFMKVKGFLTNLINRLWDESSSQANKKAYCDEEMSKFTEKEDLKADTGSEWRDLGASIRAGCTVKMATADAHYACI